MINLLSPEEKRQLRAARNNVLLLRYSILIATTIVAVGLVFGGGFFITLSERESAIQQERENTEQTAGFGTVRQEAESFEKNLATARKILSQEILYSDLLTAIAKTLPPSSTLTDIALTPESFTKPTTLSARTTSYNDALQLKNTLEDSPLFKDVSIANITQDATNAERPIAVQLSVTINLTEKTP